MDKQRKQHRVICYDGESIVADAVVSERSPVHAANALLGHIGLFTLKDGKWQSQTITKVTVNGKSLESKTGYREKGTTNFWIRPTIRMAQLLRGLIPDRYRSNWISKELQVPVKNLQDKLRDLVGPSERYARLRGMTFLSAKEKTELQELEALKESVEAELEFPLDRIGFFKNEKPKKSVQKPRQPKV